jgi:hypothetical protein
MGASCSGILAVRPHLGEVLEYISQSSEPILRMDIRKDLPHLPDYDVTRALRYIVSHDFCCMHRVKYPHRGNLIPAYGPLTNRGERFMAAVSQEVES